MTMTAAEIRENLLVGLDNLRAHKVRTGLTVLGIVIGVTSVIAVAAIIQGLNRHIQERVEGIGSRTYFISRLPFAQFGRLPEKIRRRKYLNFSDARYLKEAVPSLAIATAFAQRPTPGAGFGGRRAEPNEIRYGGERVDQVILRGVEPEYAEAIPLFSVAQGRFISRYDLEHSRPVVVLGDAIASALFGPLDPIGRTVRLNGKLYEVIGVFEKDPGLFGGPGVDQFAVIPLSDFRKRYPEVREVFIAFSIRPDANPVQVRNEVIEAMRRLRRVPYHEENDFEIISPDFLTNLWDQLTGALVILTGVISSIGLLVGGIGVMNIMLISVTERTQEIGVRKAVGARRSDIRAQFLLEAVVVTLTGGVLGILLGAAIAYTVNRLIPSIPARVSPFWMFMGVSISAAVGVFFGYYPANRAARLDPVVCLRYE
jgi:putative ABC transport system permease protein